MSFVRQVVSPSCQGMRCAAGVFDQSFSLLGMKLSMSGCWYYTCIVACCSFAFKLQLYSLSGCKAGLGMWHNDNNNDSNRCTHIYRCRAACGVNFTFSRIGNLRICNAHTRGDAQQSDLVSEPRALKQNTACGLCAGMADDHHLV